MADPRIQQIYQMMAQGMTVPQGPATPVRYDEQMRMMVPVPPPSTPVKYDERMNLMAPMVRKA
jgi:hypothetical protein